MKILLVYPNMRGMNMLPPAIGLFSALLKQRGHQVDLFDATDYPNPEEDSINSDKLKEENLNVRAFDDTKLKVSWVEENVFIAFKKKIQFFSPDLVAMSCTEDMFPIGISLLRSYPVDVPVIMGGVFPTFAKDLTLSHEEVDMICIGEGENLIVELCERMDSGVSYDDIPGLWLKQKNGTIRRNPMGHVVDMNQNPKLDLSIFEEGRLYRPMQGRVWRMFPLETHRGCPYQCAYCNSPSQQYMYKQETESSFFRKKKFDKIREEIILFRDKYNVEALYFWADTFFAYSRKEFDEFIEMYSEFKIPFWCQTRPETVTYERIKKLADIGMFRMAFGVEHGNAEFRRKYIKRNVSNDFIIKAMHEVNRVGMPYSVNNILGFPYETRELTFDTIELNQKIKADGANAYSYSPFHGTPLRKMAEDAGFIEKGLIARSITCPTVLDMPQYPKEQIEGMRRCFNLYVGLPKKRWGEIHEAEKLTVEGDRIWRNLRDEASSNNAKLEWKNNSTVPLEELAMGA
jgi:radical SAM superfamily enzyme YgiQ (UPF0313 family)